MNPTNELSFNRLKSYCKNLLVKINGKKSSLFDRIFLLYYCPNHFLEKIESQNQDQWYRSILGDYIGSNEKFPPIQINKKALLYESRDESIQFTIAFNKLCEIISSINQRKYNEIIKENLAKIYQKYLECFEKWSSKDSQLPLFLRNFTATGIYLRCLHNCLTALERSRKYLEYLELLETLFSQSIYGIRYRPHWYLRASLIADHHLKNQTLSSKLCLDGLNDCTVKHDHKIELYQRYLKLNRIEKPGECLELCPEYHQIVYKNSILYGDYRRFDGIENQTSKNCFFYTHKNGDEEMISVEELVLRHCIENQSFTKGIHSESSIYRSLFILLCWDIIYSEQIYDSFRYHQQIGPLDLNYDTFYQSRQKSFDDRVIEIENLDDITLSSALQHALDKCSDYRSLYNASVSEEDLIVRNFTIINFFF